MTHGSPDKVTFYCYKTEIDPLHSSITYAIRRSPQHPVATQEYFSNVFVQTVQPTSSYVSKNHKLDRSA